VLLHDLVQTSQRVTATGSRREKVEHLAALLRRAAPHEVPLAVAYLTGRLPQGRVGIGYAAVHAARPDAAAAEPALAVGDVDAAIGRIAGVVGAGSVRERSGLLRSLLERATAAEQEFLIRLLIGELRQGALEGVMVEGVAAAGGTDAAAVRRALMSDGDLGRVAREAMSGGAVALARFAVRLLQPIQPMLAQAAEDAGAALRDLGEASLEYKLDGARIQVHKAGDEVRVYSRRLRDVTPAVPEVVEAVRALGARELILDGEVLALRHDGRPHPFQDTMRRFGRKLDVERLRRELPLTPVAFDLLYLDGAPLVDEPQRRRFDELAGAVPEAMLVPRVVTAQAEEAKRFLGRARAAGHEGIMAKATAAPYAAGSRGGAWVKVKPAHTLDLVVLAAEWGHGRRRGWLSNLHLGARDPGAGGFVMLGKTFKGLTNAVLAWQTEQLQRLAIGRDAHTVYVRPELVVEVAFNDLQASTHYPGGLALRFARVKSYRADKTAAEADTIDAVRALYRDATGREAHPPT